MLTTYTRHIVCIFCMCLASVVAAQEPTVLSKSTQIVLQKKDWLVRCVDRSDYNSCEALVIANIMLDGEKQPGFRLAIVPQDLKNKGRKLLTIFFPHIHNAYLPNGLQVYTDNTLRVTYPFTFCSPDGCFVQKFLDKSVKRHFQRGNNATLRLALLSGKNLDIEFSLHGFSAAMQVLSGDSPLEP